MSKKNIKRLAVLAALIISIVIINVLIPPTPTPPPPPTHQNQNITLFVDLSDHLDERKRNGNGLGGIMGKDRWENYIDFTEIFGDVYTQTILNSSRKLQRYNEKIHIRAHPTTSFPLVDQYLINIDINKNTLGNEFNVKLDPEVIQTKLVENVKGIMDDARSKYEDPDKGWIGSNVFDYFKRKEFYNPEDQNLMIIYTDGYPYHHDNKEKDGQYFLPCSRRSWKQDLNGMNKTELEQAFQQDSTLGMTAATTGLEYLRVLVIGAKDQTKGKSRCTENIYEKELLEFLWSDWLQKMGVKSSNIQLLFMEDCETNNVRSAYNWLLNTPWE